MLQTINKFGSGSLNSQEPPIRETKGSSNHGKRNNRDNIRHFKEHEDSESKNRENFLNELFFLRHEAEQIKEEWDKQPIASRNKKQPETARQGSSN
ncbi:hypothetical protein CMV_015209 [Castanea mollissima]|uniref:Uncharacterized protein n=1 Tax=Castanea mollissima TaxID=60419 RepID=A0A8J4RAH8_9ROSI|nr:hypothetical protein CMV_015209 [Castanea mollissima]